MLIAGLFYGVVLFVILSLVGMWALGARLAVNRGNDRWRLLVVVPIVLFVLPIVVAFAWLVYELSTGRPFC